MAKLTKDDLDAMRRAIEWVRAKRLDDVEQVNDKLRHEGFEAAGEFAADRAQCESLHLRPWETSPCNIWGYHQSSAIELRDRLLAAGISIFEPDPMRALAEVERTRIA
jgi:hypothetical protein